MLSYGHGNISCRNIDCHTDSPHGRYKTEAVRLPVPPGRDKEKTLIAQEIFPLLLRTRAWISSQVLVFCQIVAFQWKNLLTKP